MEVKLYAPWCNSLKDKRMIVKSLIDRIKNKFNVSIAEVKYQDDHKVIGLGIAQIVSDSKMTGRVFDNILNFIEANTDAEIVDSYTEIR